MTKPLSQQYTLESLAKWDVETSAPIFNVCAVYYIENLLNGKCYVGSSIQCALRVHEHFLSLARGRHKNSHLLNAHKRGAKWAVCVLEECEEKMLLLREQFWIDELDCVKSGYNITPIAGGCALANPVSAAKHREKLRLANLRPEVREKRRAIQQARIAKDPSLMLAIQQGRAAYWADPLKSAATIEKRSKKLRSEENRKKNSENALRHLKNSPDAQKSLQAARIAYWAKPENRAAAAERARIQLLKRWAKRREEKVRTE